MSGKAPPTGPRALLNSLNGLPSKRQPPPNDLSSPSHPSSSSSSSPPSSSSVPLINRIGAPPPTGPRSLLNGNTNASSRSTKPALNGHTNPLTGQLRQLPSGPSAMQQKLPLKGKQVEIKWSDQAIASTVSCPFPILFLLFYSPRLSTVSHCRTWSLCQRGATNTSCCTQSQRKVFLGLVVELFDNRSTCPCRT